MWEHRTHPLLPARAFVGRLLRSGIRAAAIIGGSLAIGALGYRGCEGLDWIDATLNAAMLLAGEGPLYAPRTAGGKLFAIGYALFSGIVFLTVAAVLFAPALHRLIHRFHLELDEGDRAR